MCKRETFKQLAGEQCKVFVVHEPVNIHTFQSYITVSLLWDLDTQWCVKVSSGMWLLLQVLLQVACAGPLT